MATAPRRGGDSGDRTRRSTLRQERSRRTKATLVEVAERMWNDAGFDAVKVSDLCEAAGISKGSFYFYFASKEDLLVELLLADADATAAAVSEAIAAGDTLEKVLQRGLGVMARRAQRHPRHLLSRGIAEWFAALERHARVNVGHTPLQATFATAFAHALDAGEIATDISPDELGGLLEWALLRATLEWATGTARQPSLVTRLWSRVELVLRGIRL